MVIKTVGVVGAGIMGSGIAQACASAGLQVILRDIDTRYLDASLARMDQSMSRLVEKGKLTAQDKNNTLSRIQTTVELKDMAGTDLILEAALEDPAVKKNIFSELNSICPAETVFASNTSSLSITDIASGSGRPDRFCGIHFFNPVSVMKLVEIISGLTTSEATVEKAYELVRILGKVPVHVKKDSPGFIVNRLLLPYMNEAARLLEEGVASAEDIDTAVKLGLNYPMGPFEMLDMGGIDLSVVILDYFAREFSDSGYAPRLILRQMLRAGATGRKSGRGFYHYGKQ